MKLLDILVKELDEWPDGVNYIVHQMYQDGVIRGNRFIGFESEPWRQVSLKHHTWCSDEGLCWSGFTSCVSEDCETAIITKQQWLDAKSEQRVVWNGLGFPPVGTVCEVKKFPYTWDQAEIKYISADVCVYSTYRGDAASKTCDLKFLRIKTKEQMEAEAKEALVKAEMYVILHREYKNEGSIKDMVDALYESGYRKGVTTL